jgi:short-subunit dehydrogenase
MMSNAGQGGLGRGSGTSEMTAQVQDEPRSTGPWAWIAGASEGLGSAFAEVLAERGYDLVLFARRAPLLEEIAERLRREHGHEVVPVALDLARDDLVARLRAHLDARPVDLAVYNAAYAPLGPFLDQDCADLERALQVNATGLLRWCHTLGGAMARQGRGGLLLMSSLAGNQGSHDLATYAGTKGFINVFGESLYSEFAPLGVDVLVCCAGAIRTPGLAAVTSKEAPGTLDARTVAEQSLDRLERGPRFVPGWINAFAALLLGRWLPRRWAVDLMRRASSDVGARS